MNVKPLPIKITDKMISCLLIAVFLTALLNPLEATKKHLNSCASLWFNNYLFLHLYGSIYVLCFNQLLKIYNYFSDLNECFEYVANTSVYEKFWHINEFHHLNEGQGHFMDIQLYMRGLRDGHVMLSAVKNPAHDVHYVEISALLVCGVWHCIQQ